MHDGDVEVRIEEDDRAAPGPGLAAERDPLGSGNDVGVRDEEARGDRERRPGEGGAAALRLHPHGAREGAGGDAAGLDDGRELHRRRRQRLDAAEDLGQATLVQDRADPADDLTGGREHLEQPSDRDRSAGDARDDREGARREKPAHQPCDEEHLGRPEHGPEGTVDPACDAPHQLLPHDGPDARADGLGHGNDQEGAPDRHEGACRLLQPGQGADELWRQGHDHDDGDADGGQSEDLGDRARPEADQRPHDRQHQHDEVDRVDREEVHRGDCARRPGIRHHGRGRRHRCSRSAAEESPADACP